MSLITAYDHHCVHFAYSICIVVTHFFLYGQAMKPSHIMTACSRVILIVCIVCVYNWVLGWDVVFVYNQIGVVNKG